MLAWGKCLVTAEIMAQVSSAALIVFEPRAFITKIPFSVAKLTSILSTPVPALATSFKLSAALAKTSAVTFVAERTIRQSCF